MQVSAHELVILNAARSILDGLAEQAFQAQFSHDDAGRRRAWDMGKVHEAAARGSSAVFEAICRVNVYGGVEMTDATLHNRPAAVAEPATPSEEE